MSTEARLSRAGDKEPNKTGLSSCCLSPLSFGLFAHEGIGGFQLSGPKICTI